MINPQLENTVLHLPIQERAELAHRIIESLDEATPQEIASMWLDEAGRRAAQIDSGQVTMMSAQELEQLVQSVLR